jgi:Tfp pilus assembly protein PilF
MKKSKANKSKHAAAVAVLAEPQQRLWWPYPLTALVAVLAVFQVYGPALNGPFLLDDTYLPYGRPDLIYQPLRAWVAGLRPLLAFTFWLNFEQSGQDPYSYHFTNVVLHLLNGFMILMVLRKALSWVKADAWQMRILPVFGAGLFLLHPLQTESVSYVASRSENLSLFFMLAAFLIFLSRKKDSVGWIATAGILVLFGAAVLVKEHTAVFPALLLATDFYWYPGFSLQGIRRNWKLYLPIAAGGVLAGAFVWRVLAGATSAGFHLKEFTWYQYFFTECRVIWSYLLLFILPAGQNADYDIATSHSVTDHGAIFGLIGLLAISVLAWIYRRRYPLASYGWFVFIILLAPTSSFVPIHDPMAERRMYLPFIGLLLIVTELLRHWRTSKPALVTAMSVVLIGSGYLSYERNRLWGNPVGLWQDTAAKSPRMLRPQFQLAYSLYRQGSCSDAAQEYGKASAIEPGRFDLLLDWALALDCAGQVDQAIAKLQQAAAIEPGAHVYSQIGMEYGKSGRYEQALEALDRAKRYDPNFAMIYTYRGNVYESTHQPKLAGDEYKHALALDPHNQPAQDGLGRLGYQR